jgi:hypothetical protein
MYTPVCIVTHYVFIRNLLGEALYFAERGDLTQYRYARFENQQLVLDQKWTLFSIATQQREVADNLPHTMPSHRLTDQQTDLVGKIVSYRQNRFRSLFITLLLGSYATLTPFNSALTVLVLAGCHTSYLGGLFNSEQKLLEDLKTTFSDGVPKGEHCYVDLFGRIRAAKQPPYWRQSVVI